MGRAFYAACLATMGALPVQAAQPISRSMAECHVILHMTADIGERKGKPEAVAEMRATADRFAVAAVDHATREGQGEAEAHISAIVEEVTPKWDARWANLAEMQDTLDCIDYCRALGRDRGIAE